MLGQRLTSVIYVIYMVIYGHFEAAHNASPAKGLASDWFRSVTSGHIGLHYLKGSFVDARKEGLQRDAMKNLW